MGHRVPRGLTFKGQLIHLSPTTTITMTIYTQTELFDVTLFDNLFDEIYSPQEALEELSPEEFSQFLAHGSLDCDAELN